MSVHRSLNKLTFATAFILLGSFPAAIKAQDNTPATTQEQNHDMHAQPDEKGGPLADLNLTDDQRAQIKQIHQGMRSQVEAVKSDSSLTAEQKETKIHAIRRETHEQMKKVLTPEQQKQLHERRGERRRGHEQQPLTR